jgi:DNA polymerase III subunit epsilon
MATREIVLDTETTGLDPDAGHRIVEIACVELINHLPSGRTFQRYVNPERDMPSDAQAVHGLTAEFLADHPVFASVVAELLEFIGDAKLVIHNAEFDLKFVNAELARLGFPPLVARRAVDTVQLARRKFPGSPVSLDALCGRFSIDNSTRTVHGALLDAQLLAEVYLELIGGRQATIELVAGAVSAIDIVVAERPVRPPRPHQPSADELAAHLALLQLIKTPLWLDQP